MGITQLNFEGKNKVEQAVALIQAYQPPNDYFGAFSGGKDSIVIKNLTIIAGVKVEWHYSDSPIDPPELRAFIREKHPDVIWDHNARGWWKVVAKRGLPRRRARWCCELIKESGGNGRVVIVGNRAAESSRRSRQKCYEPNRKRNKQFLRPIISWTAVEVWEYIRFYNLPYCSLYDEGFKRLGCVLCPMVNARQVQIEIARFPKIAYQWRRVCDHIVDRRLAKGLDSFKTGQELWDWFVRR